VFIVRLLVWVVQVALIPAWVAAEEPNRHNVDFSGSWELDYQLSDHPSEKIRYLYPNEPQSGRKILVGMLIQVYSMCSLL
jgi:hypothetical protein